VSLGQGLGDAITSLFAFMAIGLVISVPLAIWKFIEIIIWICSKVSFSVAVAP
jgi:uncharacterized membrane protein